MRLSTVVVEAADDTKINRDIDTGMLVGGATNCKLKQLNKIKRIAHSPIAHFICFELCFGISMGLSLVHAPKHRNPCFDKFHRPTNFTVEDLNVTTIYLRNSVLNFRVQ